MNKPLIICINLVLCSILSFGQKEQTGTASTGSKRSGKPASCCQASPPSRFVLKRIQPGLQPVKAPIANKLQTKSIPDKRDKATIQKDVSKHISRELSKEPGKLP